MALVHESLDGSENLARVDFAEYAQALAKDIPVAPYSTGLSFPIGGRDTPATASPDVFGTIAAPKFFCFEGWLVVVTCAASGLLRRAGTPCRVSFHLVCGGFMENRVLGNSATTS